MTISEYEQLDGQIVIYSNSPTAPSGYGVQTAQLVEKMKRHGLDVAVSCNWGNQLGFDFYSTPYGEVKLYPQGYSGYSQEMIAPNFKHFTQKSDKPKMLLTLFDTWILHGHKDLDELPIHSWTPVDHTFLGEGVRTWLAKDNVHPIAMAPDGQRQMSQMGIEAPYIPHSVDQSIFKPGQKIDGMSGREWLQVPDDAYVFGMVSANKANKFIHRKAFAEGILAFSMHVKENPNSILYIHSEPSNSMGGFDILRLLKLNGVPTDNVRIPDNLRFRYGFNDEEMAALYEGIDCLYAPSYGEGFMVPLIEAQSLGCRVITVNYTAPQDLVGKDSIKVDGQPFWDETFGSYFMVPSVAQLVNSLNVMAKTSGRSEANLEFSKDFDTEKVWSDYWMPYLKEHLK
jgi:glycosyltransferase involved in cell wall biosynthesis